MAELAVKATIHPRLTAILRDLGPVAKRELFSVGASSLASHVRNHLRRIAPARHMTASRLGARPTDHIAKGAARVTSQSSANGATVSVPIAGISRAFAPLTLTPKNANALTIPVAAASYGHRVRELRRMGWNIFRPKGHDILMGSINGSEAQALYALKKKVTIRQDRSLLPSDKDVSMTINLAIGKSIDSLLRRSA